jgi:RNA polymerase subunit RPABC4/transcription elongation factor Spt4
MHDPFIYGLSVGEREWFHLLIFIDVQTSWITKSKDNVGTEGVV